MSHYDKLLPPECCHLRRVHCEYTYSLSSVVVSLSVVINYGMLWLGLSG